MLDQTATSERAPANLQPKRIPASAPSGHNGRNVSAVIGALAAVVALTGLLVHFALQRTASSEAETNIRQVAVAPEPELAIASPTEEIALPTNDEPPPLTSAEFAFSTFPPTPGDAGPASAAVETSVRFEKGDTFGSVLKDLGFAAPEIASAVAALVPHIAMKRLSVGQILTVTMEAPDDNADATPVLAALKIRPEPRREITIERDDTGEYVVEEEVFEVVAKLQRAAGTVDGSVMASATAAGVPQAALAELLRAFSWEVNFQHDIKVGDRFDVLIERSWTSDGVEVDSGRVLWAELTTGGGETSHTVYRFKPEDGSEFFYDEKGESVVRALLRTPLNMSRMSSGFGMRRHPVLGFTRLHAGVDFAAPPGTPILAAGSGRVLEAGPNGGYGRWIKIAHDDGLATGYAHLSRIAPGIRRSARVRQGQVIGFVGSSGLSTGPHLHFELHRNGRPVNPLSVARMETRTRLRGGDLERFKAQVVEIDRAREDTAVELPSSE